MGDIDRRHLLRAGSRLAFLAPFAAPGLVRAATEAQLFPIVETAQGKARGWVSGDVTVFKGIHYGGDTSGKNRFLPPPPPASWAGVRDAFAYGQISPQLPADRRNDYGNLIMFDFQPGGMGEDCLVLNIWTPAADRSAKKPVMVHLHGGGFYGGSGNSPGYDGEMLARFGDAVVVTINHRLGALGYLHLVDSGSPGAFAQSGMAGMLDIVAALRWVKENIEGFGGDAGRVLVFGQSGGGAKTSVLMAMPSAAGLFHRAGIMSGSTLRGATRAVAAKNTDNLLGALGLKGNDIRALQQVPFTRLLAAQVTLEANERSRGEAPRTFSPVVDGVALPRNPFDPDAPTISKDIPLIVSDVLDERSYRMTNFDLDEAGLRQFFVSKVGADAASDLLAMYRDEDPHASPFIIQARLDTDMTFRRPALALTARKADQHGAPVWSYLWKSPSPAFGGRYGAPHGTDVGPSLHDYRGGLNGPNATTLQLSDQLASAWVSLAATGDPNNNRLPHWPAYDTTSRSTLILDTQTHVENDPRGAFRRYWETHGTLPI
jgi:para-nitrobenzyl esterase